MNKTTSVLILILMVGIFTGCSSSKDLFIGNWKAKQVSQVVGKHFDLIQYNYWEIKKSEIILSKYVLKTESGKEVKVFDNANKVKYKYDWKSKNEITLDGKTYRIDVDNKQLIIKDNELEIQFERSD